MGGEAVTFADRMRQLELVAIDIDGTLLDSEHQLSQGAEDAIAQARERGIQVTLVSGRGKPALWPLLDRLGINTPYICSSGSYIADPASGQILYRGRLGSGDAEFVVKTARQVGAAIFFDEPDDFVAEGELAAIEAVHIMTGQFIRRSNNILIDCPEPPAKIFLTGSHDRLEQAESAIRNHNPDLFLAYSEATFLEITPRGADKGTAITHLARHLGIPLDRIGAIGDGANDIGMFRIAGLAVAMGNAPDHVRAEADLVGPTNDQGGVAWILREIMASSGRRSEPV